MLVSHYRHLETEEGVPFGVGLVLRGAEERLAPILMTALATGLALLPLAIDRQQAGARDRVPAGGGHPRRPGHLDRAEPLPAAAALRPLWAKLTRRRNRHSRHNSSAWNCASGSLCLKTRRMGLHDPPWPVTTGFDSSLRHFGNSGFPNISWPSSSIGPRAKDGALVEDSHMRPFLSGMFAVAVGLASANHSLARDAAARNPGRANHPRRERGPGGAVRP